MQKSLFKRRSMAAMLSLCLAAGVCHCGIATTALNGMAADTTLDNGLTYRLTDGGALITLCDSEAETIVIPDTIEDEPVVAIGEAAFAECHRLTDITFPETLETIGTNAFLQCDALTTVTLPDSVSYIGANAFLSCTALTSVNTPTDLHWLGTNAFSNCDGVLTTESGVKYFGTWAVEPSTDLNTVETAAFRAGTIGIADAAYLGAACLQSVTIPEGVAYIGKEAFTGCDKLPEITLPDSLQEIDDRAFAHCSSLSRVTIPAQLTEIGDVVFGYCTGITAFAVASGNERFRAVDDVLFTADNTTLVQYPCCLSGIYVVPDGVRSIGAGAFAGAKGLSSIRLPQTCVSISDEAFAGVSSLRMIAFPDAVQTIGEYAFFQCTALETVFLPEHLLSIQNYAFCCDTNLHGLDIPASVLAIGDYALTNTGLQFVAIANPDCDINLENGEFLPPDTVVVAPESSTAADYAKLHERPFVVSAGGAMLLGNVNQDPTIDASDATAVLVQYVASLADETAQLLTDEQMVLADIDHDNAVTAVDATYILQYYVRTLASTTPYWSDLLPSQTDK